MKGIRNKVLVSFLGVVALLFFAGMISLSELNHVSTDTREILQTSERTIELSKQMLDAANRQNSVIIRAVIENKPNTDTAIVRDMERLEELLETAKKEAFDPTFLDSLSTATSTMRRITDHFRNLREIRLRYAALEREGADSVKITTDSLALQFNGVNWYDTVYVPVFDRLTATILDHMISTQSSLAPRTEQLKKNAYRAVTPVLISLLVMIAIVLMLCYFILFYLVNPLLAMNRNLGESLRYKVPFAFKAPANDEIEELKEKIDELIRNARTVKQE